jgi:hypothetical protein
MSLCMCLFSEYYNRQNARLLKHLTLYSDFENVFADFKAFSKIPKLKLRKYDKIFEECERKEMLLFYRVILHHMNYVEGKCFTVK